VLKNVGFSDVAKPYIKKMKKNQLQRDDFEFLRVIGRGAFGEVSFNY